MGLFGKLFGTTKKQPISINDANFHQEINQSELPVVLDVWGSNCPSCHQLEPILMELAGKYDGKLKVCEMLADKSPKSTARLNITGTPTVLYYHPKGKLAEKVVGFKGWAYHVEIIENELLAKAPKS
ncbi:MAG: thioredoxin family protein [Myxococcota bacterium]|jgi:thioredoxin 1|nr:thioredoxin family protein [Myxococcota bacterium]